MLSILTRVHVADLPPALIVSLQMDMVNDVIFGRCHRLGWWVETSSPHAMEISSLWWGSGRYRKQPK